MRCVSDVRLGLFGLGKMGLIEPSQLVVCIIKLILSLVDKLLNYFNSFFRLMKRYSNFVFSRL